MGKTWMKSARQVFKRRGCVQCFFLKTFTDLIELKFEAIMSKNK